MALLPRFISLGYQGKYMECAVTEDNSNGLMQLSGEDALSPKARIEVEKALCSDELVHLKCCYKNKYLRRKSENDDSFAAVATKPEEDQSKWSCTLFRPQPRPRPIESESDLMPPISDDFDFQIMAPPPSHYHLDGGGPYYFFCPAITLQEKNESGEAEMDPCVVDTDHQYYLKMSSKTSKAAFTVTDTQAIVQLPQFVIFKADNGNYMELEPHVSSGFTVDEKDYMDAAMFGVLRMADGSVRLRLWNVSHINPYLRYKDSKIVIDNDSPADPNDLRSRFRPLNLGSKTNGIGLRLLSNNLLCKRDPATDSLVATSSQVEAAAVFEIEEAVGERLVNEINYRMEDAKLYDFAPVTSVTKDVKNPSQTTQTGELNFTYTETKSESWGNVDSWGVGVTVSMRARVPFVSVETTVGAEFEGEYQWGESKESETEIATELEVEVPPMSRTQVTMIVSRGTLVVPFSYTQRDTLYNGERVVYKIDGGVFTGVNTYVSYETTKESLSNDAL